MVFIPPKSAQVNFLWGKNDVRTAIQQFYTPPQKKNYFYTLPKQISGYAPDENTIRINIIYLGPALQSSDMTIY